jgi:Ni/Co efflux regulator RcnB
MNKLLIAMLTAAFAASPVLAQTTTAPAKDEKKAEAKKDAAPAKTEAKKAEATDAKKEEAKKKPKGGC